MVLVILFLLFFFSFSLTYFLSHILTHVVLKQSFPPRTAKNILFAGKLGLLFSILYLSLFFIFSMPNIFFPLFVVLFAAVVLFWKRQKQAAWKTPLFLIPFFAGAIAGLISLPILSLVR